MKQTTSLSLVLPAAAALVASVALLHRASADAPSPPASASAAARPHYSASPAAPAAPEPASAAPAAGDAGAPPPATTKPPPHAARRYLEGFSAGNETSPKPRPEDWGGAQPIEISRAHRGCKAFRIREYVRITCRHAEREGDQGFVGPYIYGARVVGGSEQGVEVVKPVWEPQRPFGKHGVDIVIPVHPGDRRAIAIANATPVWKSSSPTEGVGGVISETWLPGAPGPTIVIE